MVRPRRRDGPGRRNADGRSSAPPATASGCRRVLVVVCVRRPGHPGREHERRTPRRARGRTGRRPGGGARRSPRSWEIAVAVRPARDHRLVGVDDRHDPRPDRDLGAGEAVGIAAAVVPLVVVEHDRRRVAQRAGLLEDDLADLRVLRDDPPLGRGEVARLGQDLVGDRELAEVVEQARGADPLELAARAGRSRARGRRTPRRSASTACPPTTAGRRASRSSASWEATMASRPTSSARLRASAAIGARRIVPSSPVSRNT